MVGGLFFNISANTAVTGGGIAVSNAGSVVIGLDSTADSHPLIINNTASNAGGGIHVEGEGTHVQLLNAIVAGNEVTGLSGVGGGVAASNGAFTSIARTRTRCPGASGGHCSRISGNSAAFGGAVAVSTGAQAAVVSTRILSNTATQGGSTYLAVRADAELRSGNNVITDNTGPGVVAISPTSFTGPRRATVSFFGDTIADNPGATGVVAAHAEGLAGFGRSIVNAPAAVPVALCTA